MPFGYHFTFTVALTFFFSDRVVRLFLKCVPVEPFSSGYIRGEQRLQSGQPDLGDVCYGHGFLFVLFFSLFSVSWLVIVSTQSFPCATCHIPCDLGSSTYSTLRCRFLEWYTCIPAR